MKQHAEDEQNVMMLMKYLVAVTTLCLVLVGCSRNKNAIPDDPSSEIYASAQEKLQDGNYTGAIKELEALDTHYPFGSYTKNIQLELIYAYYKSANLPLAQASINRFLRLNPTHPHVDYVLYMRGLINMALDESPLQKFFGVDRSDRNPEHASASFRDFTQLIRNYPNSQYAMDAAKRMVYLKNQLAKHELSVMKHYDKRRAYVVVVNRVEQMLRDFPDTQATRQALSYMEKAYRQLQLNSQAEKVSKIRAANPA